MIIHIYADIDDVLSFHEYKTDKLRVYIVPPAADPTVLVSIDLNKLDVHQIPAHCTTYLVTRKPI